MKAIFRIGFVLLLIGAIAGYMGYKWIFEPNTNISEPYELYIKSQTTYEELQNQLITDSVLVNSWSFTQVSKLMKYGPDQIPSGRYIIQPDWSNKQIISALRAGRQSPIKLTISTARTVEDIAGVVAKKIEPDSTEIMALFKDASLIEEYGFTSETIISMIIPDTYEMYWNTDAKGFFSKMKDEYDKYWIKYTDQLESLDMTKSEIATLASIVQKESNTKSEKPTIAGVYLNRLEQGIKLQADPTVVFGIGDFTIRRVLNRHLAQDTPYNTYLHEGLPPGPICMPSKSSIEAVLNAEKHDYLFFCAKPGYNAGHAFATSNQQHERNAAVYRKWLNQERILR